MPYISDLEAVAIQSTPSRGSTKQLQQFYRRFNEILSLYQQSSLSNPLNKILRPELTGRPSVNKIVSLGLGSFSARSKDQSRRLKQLVIFLSIASQVKRAYGEATLQLYAQDPAFTKTDESILQRFGVQVLKTPAAEDLGEARQVIDESTLVYTPFLTLEAYKLLLEMRSVHMLIMDDFNALKSKWEKSTAEYRDVEAMMKKHVSQFRRRAVSGEGFWEEEDRPFPTALYWKQPQELKISSRL
ncbi:hypothetical protein B0I35DRAFT_446714 [Stachybotrys elegans]|uniref:SRR1-like domain-containing protein n=1 Tax=Stachybotrys elegans TaxID=80388 RepID=A0A8K0SCY3_9HYPO|nr:hypothetical protein B0I35DRAFT_446714 [Stachybotrys elegans]